MLLSNGQIALAKHVGSVKFSSRFIIENVLFIPDFFVNLITISKLCKNSKYKVSFTYAHCFIQDPITME